MAYCLLHGCDWGRNFHMSMMPMKYHSAVSECGAVGCRSLKTCPILHPATAAAEFGNSGLDTWHVLHWLTPGTGHVHISRCFGNINSYIWDDVGTGDVGGSEWMLCITKQDAMMWHEHEEPRDAPRHQAASCHPVMPVSRWHVDSPGSLMANIWCSLKPTKKSRVCLNFLRYLQAIDDQVHIFCLF